MIMLLWQSACFASRKRIRTAYIFTTSFYSLVCFLVEIAVDFVLFSFVF